jgi:DNA-binding NarL/FixJ family response regulator
VFNALIVEDNPRFSEALRAGLQMRFPFLVTVLAAGVQEALSLVDSMRPDLIFTDMRLSDGNGLDLTRSVRAAGIDSVISILTSHDLPEYRDAAFSSGADKFMSKGSIVINDIFDVVKSLLDSRFRMLIVAEDAKFREQMDVFLAHGWRGTVIACATDSERAPEMAQALEPDMLVLRSVANIEWNRRLRESIEELHAGGKTIVDVCDAGIADVFPVDHRIEYGAEFSHAMVTILDQTLASRADRLKP